MPLAPMQIGASSLHVHVHRVAAVGCVESGIALGRVEVEHGNYVAVDDLLIFVRVLALRTLALEA